MGRLEGKVALITGAGSGMGRVATQSFVGEGARVVAVDVNPTAVHETVASLQGQALAATAHGIGAGPLERFLIEVRALTPLSPKDEALVAADAALAAGIMSEQVLHHDFGNA